jgi:hypothetical protein
MLDASARLPPVLLGLASGLAGAAIMTLAEKLEQWLTHRPNSFVPGHTLGRLLGLRSPDTDNRARNWAMHYGTGASVGVLRGIMAHANLRGLPASAMFIAVRLSVDQTLENATGAGAPPASWPRDELAVDIMGKAVYALATGAIADALIPPREGSSAQRPGLKLRLKGLS